MRKSNRRRKIRSVAAAEQLEVRRNLSALSISDVVYQPGTHEIYGEVEHENHIDVVVDYGDSNSPPVPVTCFAVAIINPPLNPDTA